MNQFHRLGIQNNVDLQNKNDMSDDFGLRRLGIHKVCKTKVLPLSKHAPYRTHKTYIVYILIFLFLLTILIFCPIYHARP